MEFVSDVNNNMLSVIVYIKPINVASEELKSAFL